MLSLDITGNIGCGNHCDYCPQDSFIKTYAQRSAILSLTPSLFENYLKTVPTSVQIRFSGFSEPFQNPHCSDFVEYAAAKGHEVRMYTTLRGMSEEDVQRMKHIPFNKFTVHVPDDSNLTQIGDYPGYLDILSSLVESDMNNMYFAIVGEENIRPEVRERIQGQNILILELNAKAGNVQSEKTQLVPVFVEGPLQECAKMYRNNLLPNGDVTVCNMDWSLEHIIGNLGEQEYVSLFTSPQFMEFIKKRSEIDSSILCRACEYALKL